MVLLSVAVDTDSDAAPTRAELIGRKRSSSWFPTASSGTSSSPRPSKECGRSSPSPSTSSAGGPTPARRWSCGPAARTCCASAEWGEALGRVEVVDPPHRLAYRWAAHHARDTEPAEGTSTRVEFTLEPEAGGTRLRVVETGFAALATSEEDARRNHEDNAGGWREVLRMLDEYATQVAA